MSQSQSPVSKIGLMTVRYADGAQGILLKTYADTLVYGAAGGKNTLYAIRFGGYPEQVNGMVQAIHGGGTVEIEMSKEKLVLQPLVKQYRRKVSHDGIYAEAVLIAEDDQRDAGPNENPKSSREDDDYDSEQAELILPPRSSFICVAPGDDNALFDAIDRNTGVPMIPEFADYIIGELKREGILAPLTVISSSMKFEACVNLDISGDGVRAIGCNGYCAVQAKGDPECKGGISLLVPADSLRLLASIAGDSDVYELGVTGNNGVSKNVVFSDGITIFSARLMDGTYLNADTLFESIVPAATARVDAEKLLKVLEHVSSLAASEDRIELSFGGSGLIVRCEGDNGSVTIALDAKVTLAADGPYYYTINHLISCAKVLKGDVTLNFSETGTLELQTDSMRFLQIPTRPGTNVKPKKEPRKKVA